MDVKDILEALKKYGVGRRKLDDPLFRGDNPPARLGIYDVEEENLCHDVIQARCHIPGCQFTAESLLEFENHYNCSHRYTCAQCKKMLPSPHFLDLHIQEAHDSYFAVMAAGKPSYNCYIEECKEKFLNADDRLQHCVDVHKLPKDFRFDQKPRSKKQKKIAKPKVNSMEVDSGDSTKDFQFNNCKQKSFAKYTGKKFTDDNERIGTSAVNLDDIMSDLKDNLPS